MDKIQEADRNSKSGKLLNVVMVIVAIIFFFITLYMQNGRKSNSNRHDLPKEI